MVAVDVQVMRAGKRIFPWEYNLESEDSVLYQIWIGPNKNGVELRRDQKEFPKEQATDVLTFPEMPVIDVPTT